MKASSILSAAIALFSIFVAASPVASVPALVSRDTHEADIMSSIHTCRINLEDCHGKYLTKCKNGCSQVDMRNWQKECSGIITNLINYLCGRHKGYTLQDPSELVSVICTIILGINATLTSLLGSCGLLGGLLATILFIVGGLLTDIIFALNDLISCLNALVGSANLLFLVTTLLGTLLGGSTCYLCGLLKIIL